MGRAREEARAHDEAADEVNRKTILRLPPPDDFRNAFSRPLIADVPEIGAAIGAAAARTQQAKMAAARQAVEDTRKALDAARNAEEDRRNRPQASISGVAEFAKNLQLGALNQDNMWKKQITLMERSWETAKENLAELKKIAAGGSPAVAAEG
jgi:hypothetical protein